MSTSTAELGHPIGKALTEGQLFVDDLADVAGGPAPLDDVMNDPLLVMG